MATITLKKVRYGSRDDLDFTIGDREFVVLTGPGGRDGSAIVRVIAGLAEATQGDILFDDRRINDVPLSERDIALLAHNYEPYPRLTISENLAIGLKRRQFGESEIKKRIAAVADALGIQERLDVLPESLSPAQLRFVGLARAMVRQPRVYLFDRPFANLESADASRGRAAVAALQQRSSATIIYATTDPAEALALGQRTVIIDDGAIQQDADAQSIYDSPANLAVAKFFGAPPMNLVQGILKTERDGIVFTEAGEGTIALNFPASHFAEATGFTGKPAVLGFHPEAIEIDGSAAPSARSGTSFRALVERAELRGGQTDLYLRTGAHELICRTAGGEAQGAGRRLQFVINLEKAHLFDAENGLRMALKR